MPYAATPTYQRQLIDGRWQVLVTVSETLAEATSEYTIDLGSYLGTGLWKLLRVKVTRTAGTAATVAPVFGTATNPTSGTATYIGGLGAAASQDSTNSGAGFVGDGFTLYVRSVVNAGADNSITSKFYFVEGWQ